MPRGSKGFQSVKTDSLEWVLVNRNRPEEMRELRARYRYSPLDLKEVLPPLQRPKVIARDGYIFLILLYPLFDRKTREIRATEVDFFISPERLVTVNVDGYEPLTSLFQACRRSGKTHSCLSGDITQLLYAVLNDLLTSVFPMLLHVNADLDAIETRLFADFEKNLIQELLRVKTNIVNIRKTMQAHQAVIQRFMKIAPQYLSINVLDEYLNELAEQAKEIWETLEIQKETVDALHQTNQSLIDFRINEIIKTLTIFSVIVFPLTLVASIFGMNTAVTPLVTDPNGFWLILGLMGLGMTTMLLYFKHRKWI